MPFHDPDEIPWCTGRTYPNAPATHRIRCLTRHPPFFFGVRIVGLDPDGAGRNGDHFCKPWFYELGPEPDVSWMKRWVLPHFPPNIGVSWKKSAANPEKRLFEVNFVYGTTTNEQVIWRSAERDVMDDWSDIDSIPLTEIYRSPTWTHGNPTFSMLLGTYDRLPAHSCRGDYNGPWP